jgi:hypothetical protein
MKEFFIFGSGLIAGMLIMLIFFPIGLRWISNLFQKNQINSKDKNE